MIQDCGPITQALLGTLFTWLLTAVGASLVVVFTGYERKFLDGSLGFAAGVMVAASYWSLLDPALEMSENVYGNNGCFCVAFGFALGAIFVYGTDVLMSYIGVDCSSAAFALTSSTSQRMKAKVDGDVCNGEGYLSDSTTIEGFGDNQFNLARRRAVATHLSDAKVLSTVSDAAPTTGVLVDKNRWKRMILLIVAITVHNIPEGLAVGVGFGAIGISPGATFESARNLAVGIGIQNFPEGLAVSLPLKAAGCSTMRSFWYGQLSGMVEPVFGVLGAAVVGFAQPILPYALAFAAGAMIYVVFDDIIPEANSSGNGKLASWGAIAGFLLMMVLDVKFS